MKHLLFALGSGVCTCPLESSSWYPLLCPSDNFDNFEPHNSIMALEIFEAFFVPVFFECEYFLESNSCCMWDKLGWLIWFWQFLCEGLSYFNLKRFYCSYARSSSLCDERRPSFCTGLISRKLCRFLLMFLTSFTSLSVLLLFPLLITFVVMHSFWFYFI